MPDTHVFVIRGDLTHLHCDAWLLPSDQTYAVETAWYDAVPGLREAVQDLRTLTPRFAAGDELSVPVTPWTDGQPLPVLTAVPLHGIHDPGEVRPAVSAFVTAAEAAVRERPPTTTRPVPLLALPAFGTGHGGGGPQRGAVLGEVIAAARDAGTKAGVDVALVLLAESDLALTQAQRRRMDTPSPWPELSDRLRQEARHLAGLAARGRLVPFMGAGVSVSAGLPTWQQLIGQLAETAGLTPVQREQLGKLDVLDQGHVLRDLYQEQRLDFGEAVVREVDRDHYGLAPALLASLPVTQAVTLNYDRLFEIASTDAGHKVTVLPDDIAAGGDRWLLKLHGSVTDHRSIVLTRDDYLGYSANREALSAVVKALLMTHHLLFVGFGLADDHFHAIVHDVHRALPDRPANTTFGTALLLEHDELQERVWKHKLTLLPVTDEPAAEAAEAGAPLHADRARLLEIFLDCVLAHAIDSHTYLLAPEYDAALSDAERSLRTRLLALTTDIPPEQRATTAWAVVADALTRLGWQDVRRGRPQP